MCPVIFIPSECFPSLNYIDVFSVKQEEEEEKKSPTSSFDLMECKFVYFPQAFVGKVIKQKGPFVFRMLFDSFHGMIKRLSVTRSALMFYGVY